MAVLIVNTAPIHTAPQLKHLQPLLQGYDRRRKNKSLNAVGPIPQTNSSDMPLKKNIWIQIHETQEHSVKLYGFSCSHFSSLLLLPFRVISRGVCAIWTLTPPDGLLASHRHTNAFVKIFFAASKLTLCFLGISIRDSRMQTSTRLYKIKINKLFDEYRHKNWTQVRITLWWPLSPAPQSKHS